MKKILIFACLALVLVLTAVACTGTETPAETTADTAVTEAGTVAATEAGTVAATEAATVAETAADETVAETTVETVADTETTAETVADAETVAETEADAETAVETTAETEADAETTVETEADAETTVETEADAETTVETEEDAEISGYPASIVGIGHTSMDELGAQGENVDAIGQVYDQIGYRRWDFRVEVSLSGEVKHLRDMGFVAFSTVPTSVSFGFVFEDGREVFHPVYNREMTTEESDVMNFMEGATYGQAFKGLLNMQVCMDESYLKMGENLVKFMVEVDGERALVSEYTVIVVE